MTPDRFVQVQKQDTRHLIDTSTATVLCDPRLWYVQPVNPRSQMCRGCQVMALTGDVEMIG